MMPKFMTEDLMEEYGLFALADDIVDMHLRDVAVWEQYQLWLIEGDGAEFIPAEVDIPAMRLRSYAQLRRAHYPDMTAYLDAAVKGDSSQSRAYVEACMAVKARFPKP